MPVLASAPAFSLTDTLSNMTTLVGYAWDIIVANPVLSICIGSLLVGVAFSVFTRAKAAAMS